MICFISNRTDNTSKVGKCKKPLSKPKIFQVFQALRLVFILQSSKIMVFYFNDIILQRSFHGRVRNFNLVETVDSNNIFSNNKLGIRF